MDTSQKREGGLKKKQKKTKNSSLQRQGMIF